MAVAPMLGDQMGLEDFFAWMHQNFDPTASWRDLDFIRERWVGPLVLKGILDVEDAREAVALGADGVVLSNHGGRQLDEHRGREHMLQMRLGMPAVAGAPDPQRRAAWETVPSIPARRAYSARHSGDCSRARAACSASY